MLHIDFQRVDANDQDHKKVPLHFVNEENSPAVKTDALRRQPRRQRAEHLSACRRELPEFIEVDLAGMTKGQSLHVSDIKLPTGVKVVTHGKPNPVIVVGRRSQAAEGRRRSRCRRRRRGGRRGRRPAAGQDAKAPRRREQAEQEVRPLADGIRSPASAGLFSWRPRLAFDNRRHHDQAVRRPRQPGPRIRGDPPQRRLLVRRRARARARASRSRPSAATTAWPRAPTSPASRSGCSSRRPS